MSFEQKSFLKWFAGICGTLLVAMVLSVWSVLDSVDVMAERINHNTDDIVEIKETHKDDMTKMTNSHKDDMDELKGGQKIMREDIKEILKKL